MDINEIVEVFKKKPYMLRMGNNNIAKRLHSSTENVVGARRLYRNQSPIQLPKILLFDVETAPMRAYVWRRWKENISLDQTISEWFMLCWSAKWLYSDEIIGDVLTEKEAILEDDKRICEHLWELINEADIVIAYNGKRADIPWMNTRFIVNGLEPPKPYQIIDPCEVAKKKFGFSSNKLDALAGYFNIEHKLDTNFELWKKCMQGDSEALEYMLDYNKKDTVILEEVYLRLRPWITNHPNISNFCNQNICSHCGSTHYIKLENKYYYTAVGKYQLYKCKDCGTIFRGRINLNNTKTPFISTTH